MGTGAPHYRLVLRKGLQGVQRAWTGPAFRRQNLWGLALQGEGPGLLGDAVSKGGGQATEIVESGWDTDAGGDIFLWPHDPWRELE